MGRVPTEEELLVRHRPHLRWDSQDDYRALGAGSMVSNPGNRLIGKGRILTGGRAAKELSLALLAQRAADSTAGECLAQAPAPLAGARRLQRDPRFANRVYGRHVPCPDQPAVWLQYWIWLYYNPKALLGFGRHEGDWEMVQLRLDSDSFAVRAVTYAQHGRGERKEGAALEDVEWVRCDPSCGGSCAHPVVYVAPFSHASYFEAGTHPRLPILDNPDGAFFDGLPELEPFDGWNRWRGHWGASRLLGRRSSPHAPGLQTKQWQPQRFERRARRGGAREERLLWRLGKHTFPPAPAIESASIAGDTASIRWTVSPARLWRRPRWILLSLHQAGGTPPLVAKRLVRSRGSAGATRIPVATRPIPKLELRASAFNLLRQRSETTQPFPVTPAPKPRPGEARARDGWSPRVWAWFCRRLLDSLTTAGSATTMELRRRRITVLDLDLDRTELDAVIDCARRTGLIEARHSPPQSSGERRDEPVWQPSERGLQKVRGPLRWLIAGLSAVPSTLIAVAAGLLAKGPLVDFARAQPLGFAFATLVVLEIMVVAVILAHRYLGGAGPRQIATQWSRHAVELPQLNRWHRSRLNFVFLLASIAGSAVLSADAADAVPGLVTASGFFLVLVAQVGFLSRIGAYRRLKLEAEAICAQRPRLT